MLMPSRVSVVAPLSNGVDMAKATCGALETSLIFEVPCHDRDAARREGRGAN